MKKQTKILPPRLFGVTVDRVSYISSIVEAIKELKKSAPQIKPLVRVVFDFDETIFAEKKYRFKEKDFIPEAKVYKEAIEELAEHAYIMGEIVDSSAVYRCHYVYEKTYTYAERTKAYANILGDLVDIWEIGNEINGEWVGWNKSESWLEPNISIEQMEAVRGRVADETMASYKELKKIIPAALTALTFYYNDDGENRGYTDDKKYNKRGELISYGSQYSMLEWARNYREKLPDVDYVLISYYEDDNEGVRPNRSDMDIKGLIKNLVKLASMFRNAKIGFGEFGPQCNTCKDRKCAACLSDQVSFIQRYYVELDKQIRKALRNSDSGWDARRDYIGGYFYWYFKQDVVNQRNPETIDAFKKAFANWYQ